ncbi:MFS nicotinic acid transporter Tna1 [Tricladium varicosporioides]|nr:MFS nicotinic acid transporter Tna1 [Hymenoscyphus varicosporioides]
MDHRILPVLFSLYMLCYLNRGSIGNAKVQGLTEDLHMSGLKYNNCLMVYFFTYCAFMVPSNLLLKKFRPSIWLPIIMIFSGIIMALTGLIEGYKSLLIARLFSGIAESGVYSGITYYITMWYCRQECQYRQAIVFSATGAAGAFSGLLAFAIGSMDGRAGLHGWQWIFIIEGVSVVVLAILSFFFIHDFPSTASFLTPEERAWALYRLKYQNYHGTGRNVPEADRFHWDHVKAAYKDWHVWVGVLMFWGIICPLYGLSLFLPSILKRLGNSPATANILTIPIYLTASILTVATAWYSDRFPVQKGRARFIFVPQCFILAGFTIALIGAAMGNISKVVYAGMFIATCGTLSAFPGNITWISNNLSGSYKRSAGMAIQIGVGNMGGIFVSNFYRESDAPKYILGHALQVGIVVIGMAAVVILRLGYAKANKERDEMGVDRSLSLSQMSQMGDRAPTFRYYL